MNYAAIEWLPPELDLNGITATQIFAKLYSVFQIGYGVIYT